MIDQQQQKKNRGAQPGNRNAYKHGYYAARLFLDDPDTLDETTLRNMLGEIAMLKDMMYHTYRAALQTDSFDDRYKALRMITLAANTVVQLFKLHGKRSRSGMGYIPRSLREQMTEEESTEFAEDPAPQSSPVAAFVNDDLTLDFQSAWQDLFPDGFPQPPAIRTETESIPLDEDPQPGSSTPTVDVYFQTSFTEDDAGEDSITGMMAANLHPVSCELKAESSTSSSIDPPAVSHQPIAESGTIHRTTLQRVASSSNLSIRDLLEPSEGSASSATALVTAILADLANPRTSRNHASANPSSVVRRPPSAHIRTAKKMEQIRPSTLPLHFRRKWGG